MTDQVDNSDVERVYKVIDEFFGYDDAHLDPELGTYVLFITLGRIR